MIDSKGSDITFIPPKKGRGRPRKNLLMITDKKKKNNYNISKIVNELKNNNPEEEIILHLPISLKDIQNYENNSTNSIEMSQSTKNDDQGDIFFSQNSQSDCDASFTVHEFNDINKTKSALQTDSELFEDTTSETKKDYINKIKMLNNKIKFLQEEVNEYKNIVNETLSFGTIEKKIYKMNLDYLILNNEHAILPEKTHLACWWCTYNFDNVPCYIPEKIINDKYYVFGNFCSFNCAATYNLRMNDADVWNRYSLLKKLMSYVYKNNQDNQDIFLAPDREVFEKFGGPLTYEQYRKNSCVMLKEYRFIMPPMTSIVTYVEESCSESKINAKLLDLNKKNFILKRTKPLPNNNNLFDTFIN